MVVFIEETLLTATEEIPTLRLSDITKLYTLQFSALGVHLEKGCIAQGSRIGCFPNSKTCLHITIRKR